MHPVGSKCWERPCLQGQLSGVMGGCRCGSAQAPSLLARDSSEVCSLPSPRICQQDGAQVARSSNLPENVPFIVCFRPDSFPCSPTGASWDSLQNKRLALRSPCQGLFGGNPTYDTGHLQSLTPIWFCFSGNKEALCVSWLTASSRGFHSCQDSTPAMPTGIWSTTGKRPHRFRVRSKFIAFPGGLSENGN